MTAHQFKSNIPDSQVDESLFYTDPEAIDEPELFATEAPYVTETLAAVSSDTEESDYENQ